MKIKNPVLARLIEQRQIQIDAIQHILDAVESEDRELVEAERSNMAAAQERITELNAQIEPLQAFEDLRNAHNESASNIRPTVPARPDGEPAPLGASTRQHKYPTAGHFVVDYIRGSGQHLEGGRRIAPDEDARQRVESSLGRSLSADERAIAHQTTETLGGILPEPIVGEILNDLDAARPLIASVGAKPLGQIAGKTFRRPIVKQHTQVGEQTAEKTELPSRKFDIDDLEFTKKTFGGALNISRQSIDWTDPAAWNAIITDLQLQYGVYTEDWTATVFANGVTQEVNIAAGQAENVKAWIKALYDAAVMAATAAGTKRASSLRLPDTIWTSIDQWGALGAMLSSEAVTATNKPGRSAPNVFAGDILEIERVVVPGLPDGTFIVGRKALFEFYEERIGLLSNIEPKVLGIEVAYGGYAAAGHMDATGFAKVTVGSAGGGG